MIQQLTHVQQFLNSKTTSWITAINNQLKDNKNIKQIASLFHLIVFAVAAFTLFPSHTIQCCKLLTMIIPPMEINMVSKRINYFKLKIVRLSWMYNNWKKERKFLNASLRFVLWYTFYCKYRVLQPKTRRWHHRLNVIPSSAVLLEFSLVRILNLSTTHPYLFCE
jgi:hypothetical protein